MTRTSLVAAMMLGLTIGLPGPALAQGDDRDAETMIQHTIIVYQENISFDHYFGTFGHGSAGIPAGVQLFHTTPIGAQLGPYAPVRLDGRTQAATCDVDHEYWAMVLMAHGGAMDRYLQGGNNLTEPNPSTPSTCPSFEANPAGSALALAYYAGTSGDASAPLQNYWRLASQYTLADNFFSGMYGPSTPNAEWLVAATANTVFDPNPAGDVCNDYGGPFMPQRDIPNLGKAASANGVSWAWFQGGFGSCGPAAGAGYSAHHNPFQYFTSTADPTHAWAWNPRMNLPQPDRHQRDLQVFYAALSGSPIGGVVPRLPQISWVKATKPMDGHPGYSSPVADDAFVGDLVNRVQTSKYWRHAAIFVTFDETGGWWDHVAPPVPQDPHFAPLVNGYPNISGCQYAGMGDACGEAGLGPRLPLLVISPFAKRHAVDHDLMDTSSLAKWVEWNYHLPPLGVWGNRDVNAGDLRGAFDFSEEEED
jgi:phospholipase C